MLTNRISITLSPPAFGKENVNSILERINILHPQIKDDGAKQYLCDLLNINNLDEITGDFLVFKQVEPAVSSAELLCLAERILPYNDGDIEKAKYAARNILNTIPKSIDDLIDYTTSERKSDFIKEVLAKSFVGEGVPSKSIKTIDQLSALFVNENEFIIDAIGNDQMNKASMEYEISVPGMTKRQKMLYRAADYYLNHRIGFKTNTIWLACFTNNDVFGCNAGWLHVDGTTCFNTHFGFKDEATTADFILQSIPHIKQILLAALDEYHMNSDDEHSLGIKNTGALYITAIISTLGFLTKQSAMGVDNDDEFNTLFEIITDNAYMLDDGQVIVCSTIAYIYNGTDCTDTVYINRLQRIVESAEESAEVPPYLLSYFDAWNFFIFDVKENEETPLMPLFLKSNYCKRALGEFSKQLVRHLENGDLLPFSKKLFKGFFANYLIVLINRNSDDQYMYDEIFKAAMSAKEYAPIEPVIKVMAELGHKLSMAEICKASNDSSEQKYWNKLLAINVE